MSEVVYVAACGRKGYVVLGAGDLSVDPRLPSAVSRSFLAAYLIFVSCTHNSFQSLPALTHTSP